VKIFYQNPQILIFCSFLLLSVFFIPKTILAAKGKQELKLAEIVEKLQAKYEQTENLSAEFQQITSIKMSRRKKLGSGTVVFMKPGKMRWDYQKPDYQVLVCDGETFSMYFKKSNQMIIAPASQYLKSDITYSFFTGTGDLSRDFKISSPEEELIIDPVDYQLKLIPRASHPQIAHLYIWINPESFLVNRIQIFDQVGSVTDILLNSLVINQIIKPERFTFTPPPGTEILEQE
jgi:outer membrane lipoprotein carrier protein